MSLNHQKKKSRAPRTPKCLGAVVIEHFDRVLSESACVDT